MALDIEDDKDLEYEAEKETLIGILLECGVTYDKESGDFLGIRD